MSVYKLLDNTHMPCTENVLIRNDSREAALMEVSEEFCIFSNVEKVKTNVKIKEKMYKIFVKATVIFLVCLSETLP